MMSAIRSTDTSPEQAVRSFLHRRGLRFRKHVRGLPGSPDLVFKRYRTAVFVHGCFWHQHSGCRDGRIPASNRNYWKPKLLRTKERDLDHRRALEREGWKVIVIWECEVCPERLDALADEVQEGSK